MTLDQLRIVRDASPFRPFTIHMADGRSFHVPHRDYLSISPNGRIIIAYYNNESFSIIDLLLVTELAVEAPITAAGQN